MDELLNRSDEFIIAEQELSVARSRFLWDLFFILTTWLMLVWPPYAVVYLALIIFAVLHLVQFRRKRWAFQLAKARFLIEVAEQRRRESIVSRELILNRFSTKVRQN